VPADVRVETVCFDDHCHGVPANITLDAPLDFAVTGIRRLFFRRYRIDVRRVDRERDLKPGIPQLIDQLLDKQSCLSGLLVPENILEYVFYRSEPFVLAVA
jgi:hypothetical protein